MEKKKHGIVYWFIVIVGVAFIVAASVKIGESLSNDKCDCKSNCSSEELKKASKDKYEFDYFDGGAPGISYKGTIDLKTGEANITKTSHCSSKECVDSGNTTLEPENYQGKFDVHTLNKIITYLEKNNYPDKGFKNIGTQDKFMTSIINILEKSPSQETLDELIK